MGRVKTWTLAAAVVTLGLVHVGNAADGDLDTGFGANGIVTTDVAGFRDEARAVAVDGSGRIVVAGSAQVNARGQFAVSRYDADGTLDSTFGSGGKVTTDFGNGAVASAVAIDAQGRIVVAGQAVMPWLDSDGSLIEYTTDFALARYSESGSLDTNFGPSGDGRVTTQFAGFQSELLNDMIIDADGRIVVAGMSGGRFALARYAPNGTLDPSFGEAGILTTAFPSYALAYGVALDGDGRIVVAGWTTETAGAGANIALARYQDDGSLDAGFGSGGVVISDLGGSEHAREVAIDSAGRIVVAGEFGNASLVARYTANGALDATLNGSGYVATTVAGLDSSTANDLVVDAVGRITAVGFALAPVGSPVRFHFALTRHLENGTVDASFGSGGEMITGFPGYSLAHAVAVDALGNLIVVGTTGNLDVHDEITPDFAVVRYTSTGGYAFAGFFAPLDNAPAFNVAKAGGAVPVKFSLGGDYGLDILAAGSPRSEPMACDAGAPLAVVEETVEAAASRLSYDADRDQYLYIWKTQRAWAQTCRQLIVTLKDGTSHVANFRFSK